MNKITNEELKSIFELGALCQSINERIDSLEDAFFFKHKFKQVTRQFQRELDSLISSVHETVKNPVDDLNYYPRKIDEIFIDLIISDDGE